MATAFPPRDNWPFPGKQPSRLVLKLGSNVLSTAKGRLDIARMRALAAEIAAAREGGTQVVVVTSGAVSGGIGALGLDKRPAELTELQALAAIGQAHLMAAYIDAFTPHGIVPAQVLLTRADMEDRRRYLNATNTLESLLRRGAIPIINENDTVTVDELKFGDNDMLSALIAAKMAADMLVLLTDVDGLYDGNPKLKPSARLVENVLSVTPEVLALADSGGSAFGTGGMASKLNAARHATRLGVAVALARGTQPGMLTGIVSGEFRGTLFLASPGGRRGSARGNWMLARSARGSVVVDEGALAALLERGKSLLPVGITAVSGKFEKGDIIEIRPAAGRPLARGISNYSADAIERIKGARKDRLAAILGAPFYEEVIHRNNMVLY